MSDLFSGPVAEAVRDADDSELVRARRGDDAAFSRVMAPLRPAAPVVPGGAA
ncbi:hypothetical protein KIF24_14575 [Micromonospora sp. Llam7]|uniref:hypothetical protein n=1 Tax=Micromonospora tarapacensis TaxID=2835305 RepID=UPI001C830DD0|nr:hypothetical protein [Micromonospora tarapacensis]MBX7267118.1 hypothetical protein [Micromonospora tarapacensis]